MRSVNGSAVVYMAGKRWSSAMSAFSASMSGRLSPVTSVSEAPSPRTSSVSFGPRKARPWRWMSSGRMRCGDVLRLPLRKVWKKGSTYFSSPVIQ